MKIIGVVTLYHPQPDVAENILSYLDGLDALLIWDNTPPEKAMTLPFVVGDKVKWIRRGENTGIGQALNEAARYALANSFTHLLTMDQDSAFRPTDFEKYLRIIDQCSDERYFIFSPSRAQTKQESNDPIEEVADTIISGTVFPIATFKKLGFFYDTFVMDAIDTEYGLRIHQNGGKIGRVPSIYLEHQLGYPFSKKFLGWTLTSFNYSPMRTYYIARNFLYLKRLYPEYDCRYIIKLFIFRRFIRILCIEDNKQQKLLALIAGCFQGVMGYMNKDLFYKKMRTC